MDAQTIRAALAPEAESLRRDLGVVSLRVFGSHARGEGTEASDVDLLVEFGGPATLVGYSTLQDRLESILGCRVDLVTEKGLRPSLRPSIEREAIRVA